MAQKEFIQPPNLTKPQGFTHVVTARGSKMVFIAGQISIDANARIVGVGDLRGQTEQVFRNLEIALAAAGAGFDDVVKITVFVVDYQPEKRATIAEVRNQFVSKTHPPASTLVGVSSLARAEALIEIEAIAVID